MLMLKKFSVPLRTTWEIVRKVTPTEYQTSYKVHMSPRNGPKWLKMVQIVHTLCQQAPKTRTNCILATWLKSDFQWHLVLPQPTTLCHFEASESPNETPRPVSHWSLGGARGQHGPQRVGANGGSSKVPGAKKKTFSKVVPRPPGMFKHVFLARFELVVTPTPDMENNRCRLRTGQACPPCHCVPRASSLLSGREPPAISRATTMA